MNCLGFLTPDLLIESAKNKPFYTWFFQKKNFDPIHDDLSKLPALTRQDFFQYQIETGLPYYEPLCLSSKLFEYRSTSGTSGKPLRVPWEHSARGFAFGALLIYAYKHLTDGQGPILFFPPPGRPENSFSSIFIEIPNSLRYDVQAITQIIAEHKPVMFLDHTEGTWLHYLLSNGLDLSKTSVQAILAYPNRTLAKRAQEMGVHYRSVFGCMEAGLFGLSCPHDLDVYHLPNLFVPANSIGPILSSLFSRVHFSSQTLQKQPSLELQIGVVQDGRLSLTGEGRLSISRKDKLFPFLNYLNGDKVLIEDGECACGYVGRRMTFLGRLDNEIKIPSQFGITFHSDRVLKELQKRDDIMRSLLVVVELNEFVRSVFCFLETPGVTKMKHDRECTQLVYRIGCGTIADETDRSHYQTFYREGPASRRGLWGSLDLDPIINLIRFCNAFRVPLGTIVDRTAESSLKASQFVHIKNLDEPTTPYHELVRKALKQIDLSDLLKGAGLGGSP